MRLKDLKEIENWLTPKDVAERSGVTRQMIHKRLKAGKYTAVHTRQGWLIDPKSIEEFKKREEARKKAKA